MTEIDYGFRISKLVFKGKADFTEYELELLAKYKQLHDDWNMISGEIDAFEKIVGDNEELLKFNIEKTSEADKIMDRIMVGATYTPNKTGFTMKVADEFIDELNPAIAKMNVLEKTVKQNYEEILKTGELYKKIDVLTNSFENRFDELTELDQELYDNHDKYDLDMASWDDDLDDFRTPYSDLFERWEAAKIRRNDLSTNKYTPFVADYDYMNFKMKGYGAPPLKMDIDKIKDKPLEIKFGFRTISLSYKGNGELSPFELELLGHYHRLHRDLQVILDKMDAYEDKFEELDKMESKVRKMFTELKSKWDELLVLEGKLKFRNDNKTVDLMNKKGRLYNAYDIKLKQQLEENGKVGEVAVKQLDSIAPLVRDFKERMIVFKRFANKISNEVNLEIAIDLWNKEKNIFFNQADNELSEWQGLWDGYEGFVRDVHNAFMTELEGHYQKASDYNKSKREKPVIDPKVKRIKNYELPADSEQMKKYSPDVNAASVRGQGIQIAMAWTAVLRNDTSAILDIVRVSQHKKEWMHNLIFGINVTFPDLPNTEPMGSDKNIFKSPKILEFLAHLGEIPMLYFFMRSGGIGGFLLYADMVIDGRITVKYDQPESMMLKLNSDYFPIIFGRLFDGCVHFQEFCYGTGIETKEHIEFAIKTVYVEFNLGQFFPPVKVFDYDAVVAAWKEKYHR